MHLFGVWFKGLNPLVRNRLSTTVITFFGSLRQPNSPMCSAINYLPLGLCPLQCPLLKYTPHPPPNSEGENSLHSLSLRANTTSFREPSLIVLIAVISSSTELWENPLCGLFM